MKKVNETYDLHGGSPSDEQQLEKWLEENCLEFSCDSASTRQFLYQSKALITYESLDGLDGITLEVQRYVRLPRELKRIINRFGGTINRGGKELEIRYK